MRDSLLQLMAEPFGWASTDLASIPPLLTGEVHIYATLLAHCSQWGGEQLGVLDASERDRATRFHFEEDRYRFQKTRAALRLLLGDYLAIDPREVEFHEGPHGKPYLEGSQSDLQFNVSHTKGAAVLAFARGFEIGIDIEHARRRIDIEGVGRKVFTPIEQASISELGSASGLRQFFRFWTAKEAYLKATGSGLTCDPASIEADLEKFRYTSAKGAPDPLPYSLREVETGNQFQVCLAHQTITPPRFHLGEFS
jgi:phosphopantetheinyl transferase